MPIPALAGPLVPILIGIGAVSSAIGIVLSVRQIIIDKISLKKNCYTDGTEGVTIDFDESVDNEFEKFIIYYNLFNKYFLDSDKKHKCAYVHKSLNVQNGNKTIKLTTKIPLVNFIVKQNIHFIKYKLFSDFDYNVLYRTAQIHFIVRKQYNKLKAITIRPIKPVFCSKEYIERINSLTNQIMHDLLKLDKSLEEKIKSD